MQNLPSRNQVEAYRAGFVKACSDAGIDPMRLLKLAQLPPNPDDTVLPDRKPERASARAARAAEAAIPSERTDFGALGPAGSLKGMESADKDKLSLEALKEQGYGGYETPMEAAGRWTRQGPGRWAGQVASEIWNPTTNWNAINWAKGGVKGVGNFFRGLGGGGVSSIQAPAGTPGGAPDMTEQAPPYGYSDMTDARLSSASMPQGPSFGFGGPGPRQFEQAWAGNANYGANMYGPGNSHIPDQFPDWRLPYGRGTSNQRKY